MSNSNLNKALEGLTRASETLEQDLKQVQDTMYSVYSLGFFERVYFFFSNRLPVRVKRDTEAAENLVEKGIENLQGWVKQLKLAQAVQVQRHHSDIEYLEYALIDMEREQ